MRQKAILVTGGTGFTGRHFIRHAKAMGHKIIAINHHSGDVVGADKTLVVDLENKSHLIELLSHIEFDAVIHLAAISFVAHGNISDFYRVNLVGTLNLVDAVKANHSHAKIIVASSGNVYGNASQLPITESHPFLPANDYAASKCAMELALLARQESQNIIICRPFNYTGYGQAEHFLVPKLVKAFKQRSPIVELGNLDISRDFTDVRDVVSAYLKILQQPKVNTGIFNICSGRSYSLHEIIAILQRITGHNTEIYVNPDFVRNNEVKILYGSNQKLASLIGTINHYSFEMTLDWMLNESDTRL